MTTIEQVSDDPYIQAFYEVLIEDGVSPSLADTLAHRKFPGIKTDATHFAGKWHKDQFEGSQYGRVVRKIAERKGVSTVGKIYHHSLARYPGDPEAWVDSRGDIARICKERGWGCEGEVKVQREDFDAHPREKYELAPEVVERYVREGVREDPGIAGNKQKIEKLKDDIRTKMTPTWL